MSQSKPEFIFIIDVFSRCNLRCPSCIVGNKFGRAEDWPKGYMSPALLRSIIDKAISECAVPWVAFFNWTEPLLHPHLPELVRVLKERGIECRLSTNLNLREDYDFKALLASRPDFLRVSVSGFTQPVYERGHRGGDIEVVKRNMRALAEARDMTGHSTIHMEVFYHIYRYNYRDAVLMKEYAESLGFKFGTIYAQIYPVEKLIKIDAGDVSEEDKNLLSDLALPLDKALALTSSLNMQECTLMDDMIVIDVEGNAMLCCVSSMNRENRIGNFLDLSIEEIQRRRARHSLCGPCMKLGIPAYATNLGLTATVAEIGYGGPEDANIIAEFKDNSIEIKVTG